MRVLYPSTIFLLWRVRKGATQTTKEGEKVQATTWRAGGSMQPYEGGASNITESG